MVTTRSARPIQVAILILALSASLLGMSGVAAANHNNPLDVLMCGTVITTSTTLTHSVGPCTGDGLIIGADNITLDLNGHTIHGIPQLPQADGLLGGGAGVLIQDRTGVTVTGGPLNASNEPVGTIEHFDGGVVIVGGGSHTVSDLNIRDNVGAPQGLSAWGEGVGLWQSNDNTIKGNTVSRNGPWAGIGLYGDLQANGSDNNTVENNTVTDDGLVLANQQIGIRVEPYSSHNTIHNNTVSGSTLDGIALFLGAEHNTLTDNVVTNNDRDGIHLWWRSQGAANPPVPEDGATNTTVEGNTVCDNGRDGLWVGSTDNTISDNTVGKNSPGVTCGVNGTSGTGVDVADYTDPSPCWNAWSANYYTTSNGHPCIAPSL